MSYKPTSLCKERELRKKAERERDEAREQAQRLRVQLNHYTQANEMAEQAFRERDEAHKIAEQAIDDLAWFNETNAQRLRNELDQLKEEDYRTLDCVAVEGCKSAGEVRG